MSLTIEQKAKKYGFRSVKKYKEAVQKARALYKELHKKPKKARIKKLESQEEVIKLSATPVIYVRAVEEHIYRVTGMPYEYFSHKYEKWLLVDRIGVTKLEKLGNSILWHPTRDTCPAKILKATRATAIIPAGGKAKKA